MSDIQSSAADLTLNSHRLTHLSLSSKRNYISGEINLTKSELKVTSSIQSTARKIIVSIIYTTIGELEGTQLFSLETEFEGIFSFKEGTPIEQVDTFAKLNAPAVIYPFLRATISMATLSGGFPPLTLPVLNFQKLNVTLKKID